MEQDDIVDSSAYTFKSMSLGFEVTPQSLDEAVAKINKYAQERSSTMAIAPNRIINPSMATVSSDGVWSSGLKNKGKPVDMRPFEAEPTEAMLVDKSSPYNIDPETLSNLWIVRFGKEWVGTEAISNSEDEVEFWKHTANRLRELGYLEMHTLASSYRVVLRIVE